MKQSTLDFYHGTILRARTPMHPFHPTICIDRPFTSDRVICTSKLLIHLLSSSSVNYQYRPNAIPTGSPRNLKRSNIVPFRLYTVPAYSFKLLAHPRRRPNVCTCDASSRHCTVHAQTQFIKDELNFLPPITRLRTPRPLHRSILSSPPYFCYQKLPFAAKLTSPRCTTRGLLSKRTHLYLQPRIDCSSHHRICRQQ